jgi:hypothetical protein
MAKAVLSFGMDPENKQQVDKAIARRKESDPRDHELDFSKWMREAVREKLARESAAFREESLLVAEDSPPKPKPKRKPALSKKT